jgi:hypothetical protein
VFLVTFLSVFPWWWVGLTAIIALISSFLILRLLFKKDLNGSKSVILSLIVGASVLGWRLSANVPQFNNDPVAGLSPNDWLAPVITYICLEIYGAFRLPINITRTRRIHAVLALVSFTVNVLVI